MDQLRPVVQRAQRRSMKDFADGMGSEVINAAAAESSSTQGSTGTSGSGNDGGAAFGSRVKFTFPGNKVYAIDVKSATISYSPASTSAGLVFDSLSWESLSQGSVGMGTGDFDPFTTYYFAKSDVNEFFRPITNSSAVLHFDKLDTPVIDSGVRMRLWLNWTSSGTSGGTPSEQFAVVSSNSLVPQATTISSANSGYSTTVSDQIYSTSSIPATGTGDSGSAGPATGQATATNSEAASKGGDGGGGLGTGAIVGIVVGVVGGLLVVAAIAFFLLRKRRQNKKAAAGYTGTDSANTYMVDKETQGRATDSPNSPYSDENIHHVPIENVAREDPAVGTTPVPRTSTSLSQGRRGSAGGAQTPQGVSSNVAHLVEDGMTAEEIQRLEEEERQLDDEIERAARR